MTSARSARRLPAHRSTGALLAWALLAWPAPLSAQAPAPAEESLALGLEEALAIAVERNLGLDVQRLVTEEAEHDALGSWGAFDPVLSLEGALRDRESPGVSDLSGASVLQEDAQELTVGLAWPLQTGGRFDLQYSRSNERTNNTFATFDVSTTDVVTASLTQPLLRGLWYSWATAGQREAEVNFRIQEQRERETRHRLLLDVSNAYWDLVSAREELEVRRLAVRLGEEQQNRDERRLEVGTGTEVDVLQARTNVAQQIEMRIQAEHALSTAEDVLRSLLFQKRGGDQQDALAEWDRPIVPTTPLPVVDEGVRSRLLQEDWRSSLERALQARPELWRERLMIDAAEIRLQQVRSERLPQLDLDLSATAVGFASDPSDAFDDAATFEFPEYRGGLRFSIPLGNRSASRAVRSARAALRRSRLVHEQEELVVLSEVREALRNVRFQVEAVQAASTSLELARRQLEAEQSRLGIGLSTTFQVLQFQQDLAEALSTERAARAAYAKAWIALAHAEGMLDGDLASLAREDR